MDFAIVSVKVDVIKMKDDCSCNLSETYAMQKPLLAQKNISSRPHFVIEQIETLGLLERCALEYTDEYKTVDFA